MCATYELVSIIGMDAVIKLQTELEGWHYIAERPGPNNKIARVIGKRKARLLGKHLATERVWIGKNYIKSSRNEEILHMTSQGFSTQTIAKKFDLTPRQIRNLGEGAEPCQQQLGLGF